MIRSNLASISPLFSIVTSVLNSSVTKMSPIGNSVVERKAFGPIPSPAKWSYKRSSEHEILQKQVQL